MKGRMEKNRNAVMWYSGKWKVVALSVLLIAAIFMMLGQIPVAASESGDAGPFDECDASEPVDGSMKDTTDFTIYKHKITPEELMRLKEKMGTYEEGKEYNVMIGNHGTGLAPPTEEGWEWTAENLYVVDDISGGTPRASTDNSQDIWFPPIGNQDGEGSCVCFAVGYYTKTYQEAKEHNWDLSDVNWVGGYYGYPDKKQDKIMSPDFIYHQILHWYGGGDHGSTYSDAMN
ncbi:MAG TPA: hypothetical protein ENG06_01060, partial [Thermoplasmatales archaeon]|nr:hypothetical protein [Thermoplasmatales archaeon]